MIMGPVLTSALPATAATIFSSVGWVVPLVIGVILAGLLIGLVWWDAGRKRERAPRPDEQPHRPDHRTRIDEVREDEDFGPGTGLSPYELGDHSSRTAPPGTPPGHDENRGGGFGSGSLGG